MFPVTTRRNRLQECDIHQILSNSRRRETLRVLNRSTGSITLRDLSELIAAIESGETPAPRNIRETVYISLHQTHLPKLDELGVLEYDCNRKLITLDEGAREVAQYMDVTTGHGITWGEYYRGLGVVGLCAVVASLSGVPVVEQLHPSLVASGFLAMFAASTAVQLWKFRGSLRRQFFG
ncbi:DUF7344 domain-containing protein [Haloarchaeobius sp. TZWSO28]|uniref:DUF7344 domain-containing protein n=1 Tax=unclassified Haloarchaeobius TaxID=2614452 RepID=UPI003EBCE67C